MSSGGDELLASNNSSAGAGDANKIVSLNASGLIDSSMLPAIAASFTPRTDTASFAALINYFELVDVITAGANVVATLPDATTCSGQMLWVVVLTQNVSYQVTFATVSSQLVNSNTPTALVPLVYVGQAYAFFSDGSNWETASSLPTLLPVTVGGTGKTNLTIHDVMVGNGSSAVTLVAPSSTSGIALVSNGSSADPSFTSVNLTAGVTNTLPVGNGGTGQSSLTIHSVLVGNTASAVSEVGPNAASGIPLISQGSSTDPAFGTALVPGGGTGQVSFTVHGVILGEGTSALGVTAAGTTGYPLVANSSADPTFQQLSLTAGVTGVLPVANGGTGASNTTANGHILIGSGTGEYVDGQITSSGGSITTTEGAGTLNLDTTNPIGVYSVGVNCQTPITSGEAILATPALPVVPPNGVIPQFPRSWSNRVGNDNEFTTTNPTYAICPGGDGNMWYTTETTKIGQYNAVTNTDTEFTTAHSTYDVCNGPDNNMWYATGTTKIGKISFAGTGNTEYTTATATTNICTGADGNVWYATGTTKIGKETPAGVNAEYNTTHNTIDICAGPDGNVWYATGAAFVGKVTPSGTVIEYATTSITETICAGTDGNIWYSTNTTKVGKISILGAGNTEYSTITSTANGHISTSNDGYIWYGTGSSKKLGRMDTLGNNNTEYSTTSNCFNSSPGVNGGIWYTTGVLKIGVLAIYFTTSALQLTQTPLAPSSGGTGLNTLTAHNVILGEGTGNVAFAAPTATTGVPLVSNNATTDPSFGTASVAGGGTGATTLTVHGVLIGNTTSAINVTAVGTNKYPLCANTSADPTFQQLDLTAGVTGVLPIANGGTDNGSLGVSATGIYTADGTKMTQVTGTASQQFRVNAGGTAVEPFTPPAPAYGFGGNGADGAISNPSSYTAPIQKNATTFSLTGAHTLTIGTANTANTGCPTIINCTSTFTLGDGTNASTITVAAGSGASGGAAVTGNTTNLARGSTGAGLGPGTPGSESSAMHGGGSGGGFGGAGGGGGNGTSGQAYIPGGQTYSTWINGGSGGASGTIDDDGGSATGAGGNGGGSLIVCAVGAISILANAVINCLGGAGAAATQNAGGSGGGSGGLVFLASQTSVTVAGTINITGGAGSAGAGAAGYGGGGGGGGAGRIILWAPTITTTSATFTVGGGAGGSSASSVAGQSGSAGAEQSIVGTPNLPLIL